MKKTKRKQMTENSARSNENATAKTTTDNENRVKARAKTTATTMMNCFWQHVEIDL